MKLLSRSLTIRDLRDIVVGASFLGAGGGGYPDFGMKLVDLVAEVTSEVPMVSPDEIDDNEYVASVAAMGAPKALRERGFGGETLYAYEGLERIYSMIGVRFRYMAFLETGGFNTMNPIYVATMKKLSLVDADGAGGRAVPQLETSLFYLYRIPFSPFVVADRDRNIVVGWLTDPHDGKLAENIARHVTVSWGMRSGIATCVTTGWQVKRYLEHGVVERSLTIGRTIREARKRGLDIVREVLKATDGYLLFKGVIKKVSLITEAGFDFGKIMLEGIDEFAGKTFEIDFKNENMIAWKAPGEPVAMVPDSICYIGLNGDVIINASITEGLKVAIIGLRASEKWRSHPKGFEVWRPILERMGYRGDYIPIEKLV